MGKIVFNVSEDGKMSVKGNDVLAEALTPSVYVEWFAGMTRTSDGQIRKEWTDDLDMAARHNYILVDGEIRECLIYNAGKKGIVMKLKDMVDGVNVMSAIYPEDKDVVYTTLEDAEEALAAQRSDSKQANVEKTGDAVLSTEDEIKKLNSEKMSYMAKIKAINNKIKRLQEQLH